jgi:peroxiredoxin
MKVTVVIYTPTIEMKRSDCVELNKSISAFYESSLLLKLLLLTSLLMLSSCEPGKKLQQGEARIKGRIVNPTRGFIELINRTDPGTKNDTIRLNDKGEFEIIVKPDSLITYAFVYGTITKSDSLSTEVKTKSPIISNETLELLLMLDKGFDIKLWVDTKDPQSSLSVSGNGAELNNYIASKALLNSEFNLKNTKLLKSGVEEYLRFINEYKANLDKLLSGLPAKSLYLPEGFRELEAKNIYLTFNRLKLDCAIENLVSNGETAKFVPEETYLAFLKEIPFNKPEEFDNEAYMMLVSTYADYLGKKENIGKTLTRDQQLSLKYETYKKLFSDPAARERILFTYLKNNSRQIDQQWYASALEEFYNTATSDSLKAELTKLKESHERLYKDNPAQDFTFPDVNGTNHSLSDYKDNYVYICIWSTWCRPCVNEIAFLKQLAEEYKDRNIEFIGISIDEDKEKWKQVLTERQMRGLQLLARSPDAMIMKDYQIREIPRFIFFGPGGEIIMEDAPRPSSAEIREMLDSFAGR